MKKLIYYIFVPLILLFISSCSNSNNDNGNPLGGGGDGGLGGGTGNVTFAIDLVQEQQSGNLYFEFTPSTTVYITQVRAVCTAIQVDQTVPINDTADNANPLYIGPVTGAQQGQQWQFTIQGNIGNQQGTAFSYPGNFTVGQ